MASRPDRWHPSCCPHLSFYGLRISHCSACHRTFSGPSSFDAHQTGRGCRDPETLGMVERDHVWKWPPREAMAGWLTSV